MRKRRWRQFSLRALWLILTLLSPAVGLYSRHLVDQHWKAWKVAQVERYGVALDEQRYDDALALSEEFTRRFPNDPVGLNMAYQAKFISNFTSGKNLFPDVDIHGGFTCYGPGTADDDTELDIEPKKWDALNARLAADSSSP